MLLRSICCSLALLALTLGALGASAPFTETFQSSTSRWTPSSHGKFKGVWEVRNSSEEIAGLRGERGLFASSASKHHAIVVAFEEPVVVKEKELVVQYEVTLHRRFDCGGAYIKVLPVQAAEEAAFSDRSPYLLMFGPDKCSNRKKVHFILRHQNPISLQWEEKRFTNPPIAKIDQLPHLYTLHIRRDNTFFIYIDMQRVAAGNLLEDLSPPVNPPAAVSDPNDTKPADWVDEAKIPDPTARKPDDWDEDQPRYIVDPRARMPEGWLENEPKMIPDRDAEKPQDWNDALDGKWEPPEIENPRCAVGCGPWKPPLVRNPKYRGKWQAPLIDNPKYKGPWKPKQIDNPHYFVDKHPHNLPDLGGIGIEIWTVTPDIEFDNFFLGHDLKEAFAFAKSTWKVKHKMFKEFELQQAAIPFTTRVLAFFTTTSEGHAWLLLIATVLCNAAAIIFLWIRRRRAYYQLDFGDGDDEEDDDEGSESDTDKIPLFTEIEPFEDGEEQEQEQEQAAPKSPAPKKTPSKPRRSPSKSPSKLRRSPSKSPSSKSAKSEAKNVARRRTARQDKEKDTE